MAEKQNESTGPTGRGSLKDEIIQRIREQDAAGRDAAGGARGGTVRSPGAQTEAPVPRAARRFFGTNVKQMAVFMRQMATLVDVGIPLLKSLQILAERSSDPHIKKTTQDIARRVEEGQSFSSAMAAHPRTFSPMVVGVVRAGEAGGILEESLRRLADMLERRNELRRRIISAVMYPAFAFIVEVIVLCVVMFYAMPRMLKAYPESERDRLPAVTVWLMNTSDFLTANWLNVLIGLIVVVFLLMLALRTEAGHRVWQNILLRLPILGNVARKVNVARFARTLGSLLTAGIPLIASLKITAESSENALVEETLLKARDTVETGGKMEGPLRSKPVFDPIVVDMVMVGDEAGALDVMLTKIADTYESEVDSKLKALTSIIEPLLVGLLGLAVLFVALAVFVPYFRLVGSPTLVVE
ncbi:MAG: type II secretion system F family protein [Candidatus Sumerlaeaceae bacterium]|nr:type II secretion system F family protein [Candidatus Sumerlaeaceae bacterium]